MLHYPDDISGNKLYKNLSIVIHLSGRFVYPDDFAGNQSVRINEARLYSYDKTYLWVPKDLTLALVFDLPIKNFNVGYIF
jgi:hypothetical protein